VLSLTVLSQFIHPDNMGADRTKTSSILASVGMAAARFHEDYGQFSEGDSRTIMLQLRGMNPRKTVYFHAPVGEEPGLIIPKDAWDRDIICLVPSNSTFVVRSFGANGRDEGGAGDDLRFSLAR